MFEQSAELSKAKRKGKTTMTWGTHEAVTFLVTNQIFVSTLVPRRTKEKRKKNKKGKGQNTQSQISHQRHHSRKCPVDP